jgi:hypothetical protein
MTVTAPDTAQLRELLAAVGGASPARDDAERIDRVRLFEELKAAIEAAQAGEAVAFDRSQRAAQAVAGEPPARQGRGVAAQLGLALRVSPWRAQRWLGWAKILTGELPAARAELSTGRVSAWKTMLLARETAGLSREDRAEVDRELAPKLAGWGDRQVEGEARKAAYRLDPHAAVARARVAESERHVSIRPVPDAMARLSIVAPVAQAVAAYAALRRHADTTTAADGRGRGQLMADTAITRLTGQSCADAVPVEAEIVMTDLALLAPPGTPGREEPAHLTGYGPIPASFARDLVLGDHSDAPRWLRRLYRAPKTGQLAAMDSTRRAFTANQRRFLRLRDQTCRTPYCDAPIRHADHVHPHEHGGSTSVINGEGLCEAGNYAKQAPGWSQRVEPDGSITTRTPTGHEYRSHPPDPPRGAPPPAPSELERRGRVLLDLHWAA